MVTDVVTVVNVVSGSTELIGRGTGGDSPVTARDFKMKWSYGHNGLGCLL